ncbi:hypothetical protein OSB04_010217 [Centaurea solstitialis]|uniref:Uncharacterized protein n=1 Tax=Centaurea solstitialis TaxID=347529 RepID=A0AA38TEP6_9ASTR|nr:hypothetical protein OSB04_010217 [Centaurea solstitialis]
MSEKMDNAIVHAKIVGRNNENALRNKDLESSKQDCLSKPADGLPSSLNKLQVTDFCTQKLFLQQMSGLNKRIPKQIMGLEEKYLRHCLELIHMRANSWPIDLLPCGFGSRVVGGGSGTDCDALFLFSSGAENVVISSCMDPIVGSITGSTSMINLLTSPLLRQLGASNVNHGNKSAIDVREPLSCIGTSSFGGLSLGSSQDLQKKRVEPEDQIFGSEPVHERIVSLSSTNSTFSDPSSSFSSSPSSSSSSSSAYCQGMLHCSWNNGFPRYVFSVEDQREVYTTNLSKVEGLDYVYMFHSRAGKRETEADDEESDLVGKMRVSTSFTLCPFGAEIMETQFSLCATGHHGIHTSNQTVRKNKGLSKKVANIFRGNHSYRQRSSSKFDGSFVIQDKLLEASKEGNEFASFPSNNLELAAIVVKDHIPCSQKKVEVGGWGLKFLKEDNNTTSQSVPCHGCSSSMDVVVPADFHGGPKTKIGGGPSSLVERWRSGGSCDCGGWDLGCPLTVLNAGPNNKDRAGVFGKSNSFELFTQGCNQSMAVVEVKNVHDGLYYIQYQSTLSALQSLSIAVAIIHSHSPSLKPKVYRN